MEKRSYRLGKRQAAADATRAAILAAARDLLAESGGEPSVGDIARRAGCSRITIYNRFGSRAALMSAVAGQAYRDRVRSPDSVMPGDPRERLWRHINASCLRWASDPALFRRIPADPLTDADTVLELRGLAERLAESDQLRPGCSIREAEDVIGALTSFPTFDRLFKDGRRSPSAVAEILLRMAGSILAP
jgi:AcrR family transcriptional regulator